MLFIVRGLANFFLDCWRWFVVGDLLKWLWFYLTDTDIILIDERETKKHIYSLGGLLGVCGIAGIVRKSLALASVIKQHSWNEDGVFKVAVLDEEGNKHIILLNR